jgi:hypothetical protein
MIVIFLKFIILLRVTTDYLPRTPRNLGMPLALRAVSFSWTITFFVWGFFTEDEFGYTAWRCYKIQSVPLTTEPGISLIILLRVATIRCTKDTFLFISHTTNALLFKFRCNIFISVRIIKELQGSVASGTICIMYANWRGGAATLTSL